MKSEIAGKRKKEKTFEKKNETPRAVLIPQEHNKRKETKISFQASFFEAVSFFSLVVSLSLTCF